MIKFIREYILLLLLLIYVLHVYICVCETVLVKHNCLVHIFVTVQTSCIMILYLKSERLFVNELIVLYTADVLIVVLFSSDIIFEKY